MELQDCTIHWSSLFVIWLLLLCALVDGKNKISVKGSMGSKSFCKSSSGKTRWLSEKTSALITGKKEGSMPKDCSIIIGAAVDPSKNVRLRIHFDFLYFDSCGVKLQINQSSTHDFDESKNNREMFMSGCNRHNPGPLYTEPQNYILISLTKTSKSLAGYNFRLNVSVAENLPVTGAPLRSVIIVSFVCFVVVVGTAFILFKYINHLSMEWGETRREETMDRAIHLYNSSSREASGEDDATMALVEPGMGVRSRQPRPEIAFVHSDGRVLRFQPRVEEEGSREAASGRSDRGQGRAKAGRNHRRDTSREEPTHFYLSFSQQDRQGPTVDRVTCSVSDNDREGGAGLLSNTDDTASIGGVDLPPPYEEALAMPLPLSDSVGSGAAGTENGACGGGNDVSRGKKKAKDKGGDKNRLEGTFPASGSDVGGNNDNGSGDDVDDAAEVRSSLPPPDYAQQSPPDQDYMNYLAVNLQNFDNSTGNSNDKNDDDGDNTIHARMAEDNSVTNHVVSPS